jgi:hypothetical protein
LPSMLVAYSYSYSSDGSIIYFPCSPGGLNTNSIYAIE